MAAQGDPDARASRRAFLRRAALLGLAAAAGGLTLHQTSGYAVPPGVDPQGLRALSPREAAILAAAAARFLVGLDVDPGAVVGAADGYLARRAAWTQREVRALLEALERSPPLVVRRLSRFTRLDAAGRDAVIDAWAGSRLSLLRQGYHGLKGLVLMGAYARPEALRAIGYDGPPFG